MRNTLSFLVLMMPVFVLANFGANELSVSDDALVSQYENSLTNVVLQLNDACVFEDWLDSFRKADDYSPDAMLKALVSIVERSMASTNAESLRMARDLLHIRELHARRGEQHVPDA